MRKIIVPLLFILLLPNLLAISIDVVRTSFNEVMVSDLSSPVSFDLKITNYGPSEDFEFYNLVGFSMFPVGTTHIDTGETKEVKLAISPIGEFDKKGSYTFQYFIRGQDKTEKEMQLTFNIIDLKDAFEISAGEVDMDSGLMQVIVKNNVNFDFEDISADFSSAFFDFSETFDLAPFEEKQFEVELNNEDFKKLQAGFYTVRADLSVEDETINLEGTIEFNEKTNLVTTSQNYGFLINTQIITKTNEGNVVEKSETFIEKGILSRLFTSFSPEPDAIEWMGTKVEYTWAKEIRPSEKLEIIVKTNWLFPIIIVLLLITTTLLVRRHLGTKLLLKKKIAFVRTHGGEFALKVSIIVHSKKYVERVNIIDRLPSLVKVHERFGGTQPLRVDEKTRRIEWTFDKLEAGEKRFISYIIYSKVGVVGKFALPTATAIYEEEGKIKESESNRAFFVAEERKVKENSD